MKPHVVRQGETVASIIARNGGKAEDADAAWNDAKNEDLRKLRGDPSILFAGDVLFIPDPKPAWLPVSVGATNSFKCIVPTQNVRIALGTPDQPLAGEPYVIHGLGVDIPGTTNGSGVVTVDVPVTTPSFVLEMTGLGYSYRVMVGHLDPATETSGVGQRLSNLGFNSILAPLAFGPIGNALGLIMFQVASGQPPAGGASGECDDATKAALKKAHGT